MFLFSLPFQLCVLCLSFINAAVYTLLFTQLFLQPKSSSLVIFSTAVGQETEIPQYLLCLSFFIFTYLAVLLFCYLQRKLVDRYWFPWCTPLALGFVVYLLLFFPQQPGFTVFFSPLILVTIIVAVICSKIFPTQTARLLPYVTILATAKILLPAWVEFDIGNPHGAYPNIAVQIDKTLPTYPFILLSFVVITFLYLTKNRWRQFFNANKKPIMISATIGTTVLLLAALLPILLFAGDRVDSYFGMIPAYHLLHGGVPLATMSSQYGIGFFLPWVLLQLLFPHMPLSAEMATIIHTIFLFGYICMLFMCLRLVFKQKLLLYPVLLATIYYAVLLQAYHFSTPYNILRFAALAPFRFGIFIIPFLFLGLWYNTTRLRYLIIFHCLSIAMVLYSYEVGLVMLVAGLITAFIGYYLHTKNWKQTLLQFCTVTGCTVIAMIGLVTIGTLLFAHQMPDISLYTLYAAIFNAGFFMITVNGQTIYFIPCAIATVSGIVGIHFLTKRNTRSVIFIYLTLITFVSLSYFFGRSYPTNIYPISIPVSILVGLLADIYLREKRTPLTTILLLCCFFYFNVGIGRVGSIVLNEWRHPIIKTNALIAVVHDALTNWRIKTTEQYLFLKSSWDPSCPLAFIDSHEQELVSSLKAEPAFMFPFFTLNIFTKQQVDLMLQKRAGETVCLFVTNDMSTIDPTYRYFIMQINPYATLVAEKNNHQFELYRVTLPKGN